MNKHKIDLNNKIKELNKQIDVYIEALKENEIELNNLRNATSIKVTESIEYKQLKDKNDQLEIENGILKRSLDKEIKIRISLQEENEKLRNSKAGPKPNIKLSEERYNKILQYENENKSINEICSIMNISRSTYFRCKRLNNN